MKRLMLCLFVGGLSATPVTADTLGGSMFATYWAVNNSGSTAAGGDSVDLEDDLGLDDEEYVEVGFGLEHPVPIVPNFRYRYIDMDQVGYGAISTSYDGVDFDGPVQTSIDLSHHDLALYWEVLDNVVELDAGLALKLFNGELKLRQANDADKTSNTDIDDPLPLLYLASAVNLPLNFSVGARAEGIRLSDDSAYDIEAYGKFVLVVFAVEAGYRRFEADLEDISGIDVDATQSGPYIRAGVEF